MKLFLYGQTDLINHKGVQGNRINQELFIARSSKQHKKTCESFKKLNRANKVIVFKVCFKRA